MTFAANANKIDKESSSSLNNFKGKSTSRIHHNYHNDQTGDFFNVVYLIKHTTGDKQQPSIEIIVTTKNGQLILNGGENVLIGEYELSGIDSKSLDSGLKEELFFSDPVFDQFINDHVTTFNQLSFLNKNYSESECNSLESAIDQVFAMYMHLRRTSNDDNAIASAQGVLMGLIGEFNSNC